MSGTPTTGDEDSQDFTSKGLDQLQRLLLFLRHERYGTLPESMDQTMAILNQAVAEGNVTSTKLRVPGT